MQDDTTRPTLTSTTADTPAINSLTGMIATAAAALARATTSAEVLDVIQHTIVAYDAARISARLEKAKQAHAEIIAACHKAMADALEIEAQAQCRIADEYDAAQQRGDVAKPGGYARGNRYKLERFAAKRRRGRPNPQDRA